MVSKQIINVNYFLCSSKNTSQNQIYDEKRKV